MAVAQKNNQILCINLVNKECDELTPNVSDDSKLRLVVFSNDLKYLAFTCNNNKIYVYDIKMKSYQCLSGNTKKITQIAF